MTVPQFRTWQSVQAEVLRRIHARDWKPGAFIPNEADLSAEFGCSRATVNRALQSLAEDGILERRRKAGTRVVKQPVAKATLEIAAIRHEVEDRNRAYGYQLVRREFAAPPTAISGAMRIPFGEELLHISALHLADHKPYAFEDRWVNLSSVPSAADQDFQEISANEWLLENVPFTNRDIAFFATPAVEDMAQALNCPEGSALLCYDRLTWDDTSSITKACITYAPDHQLLARF